MAWQGNDKYEMIKNLLIGLIYLGCANIIYSQNLIQNPSFEDFYKCPGYSDFTCDKWTSSCGSVDYFNSCAKDGDNGVPHNSIAFTYAHTGNAFSGFICSNSHGAVELLQGTLKKELADKQLYRVSYFIKLPNYQYKSSWNIGIHFSRKRIVWESRYTQNKYDSTVIQNKVKKFDYLNCIYPYKYEPQLSNEKGKFINDTTWVKLEYLYRAKGGEKYLTFGYFYIHSEYFEEQIKEIKRGRNIEYNKYGDIQYIKDSTLYAFNETNRNANSYYFIDDVSVTPVDENGNEIILYPELLQPDSIQEEPINIDSIKIGEPVTLKNIYFELDKSELLAESYRELNKLVKAMQENKTLEVEISGHTDNTGTEEYNQKLSEARAKAVVNYLTGQGILPERLKYKGYGRSKPIADNTTEEGRAKNRRVEFTILKK